VRFMVLVLGNADSEGGVMPSTNVLETPVDALTLRLLGRRPGARGQDCCSSMRRPVRGGRLDCLTAPLDEQQTPDGPPSDATLLLHS
jgi:hypothetical protein